MTNTITAGHYFVPNYGTKLFQELTLVKLPKLHGSLAIMRKGTLSESVGGGGKCMIQFVDAGTDLHMAFPIMQNRGKTRSGWGVGNLFKRFVESSSINLEEFLEYLEHHFDWNSDDLSWDMPSEVLSDLSNATAEALPNTDFEFLKSVILAGYGCVKEPEVVEEAEENTLKTEEDHEIEQIIEQVLEEKKSAEWGSW